MNVRWYYAKNSILVCRTFWFRSPYGPPKEHPITLVMGCFFGGSSAFRRENPSAVAVPNVRGAMIPPVLMRTAADIRRNECAVVLRKKFDPCLPHILVQIPLWYTKEAFLRQGSRGLFRQSLSLHPFLHIRVAVVQKSVKFFLVNERIDFRIRFHRDGFLIGIVVPTMVAEE